MSKHVTISPNEAADRLAIHVTSELAFILNSTRLLPRSSQAVR
jgi:hypothetical protein